MKPYVVQFEQLNLGEHHFDFDVDSWLFKEYENEDVLDASFKIDLILYKTGNMMNMKFRYDGKFTLPCDRCTEAMFLPIMEESKLVVKFGQEHHEDLDELIVLEDHEHEIDLTQYFYESLSLFIPVRHVHNEKECNPEILKRLRNTDAEGESDETDPRWEKLKEI